ncbi:MAG: phage holin family protein [Bacteroidaceae bacterium]|nr:phage holin family protein [Bacteroidaceae bacterium]
MISSDKNIEFLVQLFDAIRKWMGVKAELMKVDAADKGVRILAALIFIVIFMFILSTISILLSVAIALTIGQYTGMAWAFVIMAFVHIVFFLLLIIFRSKWVVNPLVRLFSKILAH